jgi:glycosyltransferase involved in cell wall biosynthesis
MRILLITQMFPPEMGAAANRMHPLARELVAAGHDVFVATGMPNYPTGVVFPEYRNKRFLREQNDGVKILRTAYFTVPRNQSKWRQLASYLSFIPAALRSGLAAAQLDIVFVTSPPIFPVLAAIALARLRRAKLVLDLRDLWPDEIIACGAAREGSLPIRLIRLIERAGYRAADRVCCTTPAFVETVVTRGVAREKIILLPNGADLETFRPLPRDNSVAARYPFGDRFVVMYSGLLGIKHGLEVLLHAAAILRNEREVLFCFAGSGPQREALQQCATEMGLQNVLFTGEHPVEEVPYLLARADICVSTVRPEPYLEKIVSVKLFEYLACEKPVVVVQSGETARVLLESGGGIAVGPGDACATAEAIRSLYGDPERRRSMGQQGRRYVERNYSRSVWAAQLEQQLSGLA